MARKNKFEITSEIDPKLLAEKAAETIQKIEYLNIASVTPAGLPWNSPVYTAFDSNLNFYWVSWKDNQHSINLRNDPNAFATIYDSTVPCSTDFGVYLQGKVRELHNPLEMLPKLLIFYGRRGRQPRDFKMFLDKYPRRMYEFHTDKIWVNGDAEIEGNFIDVRTELTKELVCSELK